MKTKEKDERKHIAISKKVKDEFSWIAKIKGMTHEGLIKYFIEKECK